MITRRDAARSAALTAFSYSRILGANDGVGLVLIGTGGRGTYVTGLFQKNSDIEVRALCDVYPARFREALSSAPNARTFADHRKLLELAEVDAVLIGSPDHWHKDHAVDAMNAGKDVYSEKPMCRLREEAPVMVRTGRAARLKPMAAAAASTNRDIGNLAIIENRDGVVETLNQFDLD